MPVQTRSLKTGNIVLRRKQRPCKHQNSLLGVSCKVVVLSTAQTVEVCNPYPVLCVCHEKLFLPELKCITDDVFFSKNVI